MGLLRGLEFLANVVFGPFGWTYPKGKSEYYRERDDGPLELCFGPLHQNYSDTPWGWYWNIRIFGSEIASGHLEDHGCWRMWKIAALVDERAKELNERIATHVPGWTVSLSRSFYHERTVNGLRMHFSSQAFASGVSPEGRIWRWGIVEEANNKFLGSGELHIDRQFDFATVAAFVEAEHERLTVSLGPFR